MFHLHPIIVTVELPPRVPFSTSAPTAAHHAQRFDDGAAPLERQPIVGGKLLERSKCNRRQPRVLDLAGVQKRAEQVLSCTRCGQGQGLGVSRQGGTAVCV
eukprot:364137-Chlamydomonas_euryale.AAC.5